MSIAGNSVDGHKGHERKVSKSVALAVLAKIKAGKSSVMAEARRLGCYHATLRKEIRSAIGSKQYAKLFAKPPSRALSKSEVLSMIEKIKAGKSSREAGSRALGVSVYHLSKAMRAVMGAKEYAQVSKPRGRRPSSDSPEQVRRRELRKSNQHRKTQPTFSHVAGAFCCGRCGSDHLKAGTDGNGGGILWCVCGWTRVIPRVRATATTLVRPSREKLFVVE